MEKKENAPKSRNIKEKKEVVATVIRRSNIRWRETFTRQAYAKVNAFLKVFSRRPDQYHDLKSLFFLVDLSDTVSLSCEESEEKKVVFTCTDPFLEKDDNLVVRMTRAFLDAFGLQAEVRIHLEKNIPYGSGLGGGSSDAAITLSLLERVFLNKRMIDKESMRSLCFSIGADVPFFYERCQAAWVTNAGRDVSPVSLSLEDRQIILAIPNSSVSSGEAYKLFDKQVRGLFRKGRDYSYCIDPSFVLESPHNGLEAVILRERNDLLRFKLLVQKCSGYPFFMTGSGAVFWAVVREDEVDCVCDKLLASKVKCIPVNLVEHVGS